jgi:hypothetical protein
MATPLPPPPLLSSTLSLSLLPIQRIHSFFVNVKLVLEKIKTPGKTLGGLAGTIHGSMQRFILFWYHIFHPEEEILLFSDTFNG